MVIVDSHCHLDQLDLTPYDGKLDGAIEAARQQGVEHMLCVCIDLEHFPDVLAIAQKYDNIYASVGLHPNERDGREATLEELVSLAADPNVIAIGETGLDYYRSGEAEDWQHQRFHVHIEAARQTKKPLIIHSRAAKTDTLKVLEEHAQDVGGVMHCFAEDWEMAERAMDIGFYISLSGIVTFKNAHNLHEVAKRLPLDRLLVETDSPYLAPMPYRGKPNEPAYVRYVVERIAELRGIDPEIVAEHSTRNFFTLFRSES